MVCYLQFYQKYYTVTVPTQTAIFADSMTNLTKFEAMKPDNLIGLALGEEGFTIKGWIEGKKSTVLNSDYQQSMLEDNMIYIIGAAVLAVIVLLMVVCAFVCRKHKKKILSKVKDVKKKFLWNGAIRALQISYITQCMSAGTQLKLWIKGSPALKNPYAPFGLAFVLLLIVVLEYVFLRKNYDKILDEDRSFREKYGNLWAGIGRKKKLAVTTYAPVFLLRRLFLAAVPIFLFVKKAEQIQILVFTQSMFIVYYMSVRPFDTVKKMRLDLFNEIMVQIALYHLLFFTFWATHVSNLVDAEGQEVTRPRWPYHFQDLAGYSFALNIIVILIVNLVIMMKNNMAAAKNRKRLLKLQKAYRENYKKEQMEKYNSARLRNLTLLRKAKMNKRFGEKDESSETSSDGSTEGNVQLKVKA